MRCRRPPKDRDTDFFEDYYKDYERYKFIYSRACELLKKESIKGFELQIPRLSPTQIQALNSKGKYNAVLGSYLLDVSECSKKLASFLRNTITFYRDLSKAEAYLKDASHEIRRALTLIETGDWNGSVEASQHSIEHSIKSLFRLVGVEHPLDHDPTKKFEEVVEKLELQSYELTNLARIRWLAKVWATIHEESMYAFRDIPAKKFFCDKDARLLRDYAEEVYSVCFRLVNMARQGQLKILPALERRAGRKRSSS